MQTTGKRFVSVCIASSLLNAKHSSINSSPLGKITPPAVTQTDHAEIYRQRYETWRYLDRMKWQMVQILVAIVSASAVYTNLADFPRRPGFWVLLGLALILISWAIYRISSGIRANQRVLRRAAEAVGDTGIPEVRSRWRSVSHYIMLLGLGSGMVSTVSGLILFFQQPEV